MVSNNSNFFYGILVYPKRTFSADFHVMVDITLFEEFENFIVRILTCQCTIWDN